MLLTNKYRKGLSKCQTFFLITLPLCLMGIFRFKEFEIDQRDCAMKINTDGVLLGTMADGQEATRILDVGTGTGVIALMLAQRFVGTELIGIEIDEQSASRARQNVELSPFSRRIHIVNNAFQDFSAKERVDLIVSNPPFYTDSLHSIDGRRKTAKHADMDFFRDFFSFCDRSLLSHGRIEMIVPTDLVDRLELIAVELEFVCTKKTAISSFQDSEPIRYMLGFNRWSKKGKVIREGKFYIYAERGVYSEQYKKLLEPFFLAF